MQFALSINLEPAAVSNAADVALLLRKIADQLEGLHNDKNSEPPILWDEDRFAPISASGISATYQQVGQWEFMPGSAPLLKAVSE